MAKTLIEVLDDYYTRELSKSKNNIEAYENARHKFEEASGITAPPSFDAFRKRKERKRRK